MRSVRLILWPRAFRAGIRKESVDSAPCFVDAVREDRLGNHLSTHRKECLQVVLAEKPSEYPLRLFKP